MQNETKSVWKSLESDERKSGNGFSRRTVAETWWYVGLGERGARTGIEQLEQPGKFSLWEQVFGESCTNSQRSATVPCRSRMPSRTASVLAPYTGSSGDRRCPCKVMTALCWNGDASVPICKSHKISQELKLCFLNSNHSQQILYFSCLFWELIIQLHIFFFENRSLEFSSLPSTLCPAFGKKIYIDLSHSSELLFPLCLEFCFLKIYYFHSLKESSCSEELFPPERILFQWWKPKKRQTWGKSYN